MYTEVLDLDLQLTNNSTEDRVSHVYIITSHPIFFGFT